MKMLFQHVPQVYKVWNAVQSRMEALSVMDRDLVAASGNTEVVSDLCLPKIKAPMHLEHDASKCCSGLFVRFSAASSSSKLRGSQIT